MPSIWLKSDGERFARAVSLYRAMTGDTDAVDEMKSREILVGPFRAAFERGASGEMEFPEAFRGLDAAEEAIVRWVDGAMRDGDLATIAAFPGTYPIVNEIINYAPTVPPATPISGPLTCRHFAPPILAR